MGFPILVRWHLYIKPPPGPQKHTSVKFESLFSRIKYTGPIVFTSLYLWVLLHCVRQPASTRMTTELDIFLRRFCGCSHIEAETKWPPFRRRQFQMHFFNENIWIWIKISLKFVLSIIIDYKPALVQIMAWRRPGDKPLSEPMLVTSLTHIYVTRPQWVKYFEYVFFDQITSLKMAEEISRNLTALHELTQLCASWQILIPQLIHTALS